MTALNDFLKGKCNDNSKGWCNDILPLVDKDPEAIYNSGSQYPGYWIVVLAYTNSTVAKTVILQTVKNIAILGDSDIKIRIDSLSVDSTKEELAALEKWAVLFRRKGILYAILYATIKFLQTGVPEITVRIVNDIITCSGASKETLFASFSAQVDLATWKGPYT